MPDMWKKLHFNFFLFNTSVTYSEMTVVMYTVYFLVKQLEHIKKHITINRKKYLYNTCEMYVEVINFIKYLKLFEINASWFLKNLTHLTTTF